MPPRIKGRQLSKGKTDLMPPPPAPVQATQATQPTDQTAASAANNETAKADDPLSQKLLGPEVKVLRECLIDSATTMAQLVNHHTDVQKVGVQKHIPYPPRSLKAAWLQHSERYEEILDSIEVQVRRALAAVEYQIEQEKERIRIREKNEELQKANAAAAGKGRRPSMFIDLPPRRFDDMAVDPLAPAPDVKKEAIEGDKGDIVMQDGTQMTEEPLSMQVDGAEATSSKAHLASVPSGAVVPKDPGLSRTSRSSISLTSLNRHGLRLDLSSISIDPVNENKSSIAGPRPSALGGGGMSTISAVDNAMASPVTLAPKSARPKAGYEDDFSLDLFGDPFLGTTMEGNQLPAGDITSGEVVPPPNIMEDLDLFGDGELGLTAGGGAGDTIPGAAGVSDPTMASLFSDGLFDEVKDKDDGIALLGSNSDNVAAENKLFEQFGFPVPPNASSSSAAVPHTQDLSLPDSITSFDFSSIGQGGDLQKEGATAGDFNLLNMEDRQLQQRQQFGIDLNATQAGDQDVGDLNDFPFDLFGTADASGEINFDSFFSSNPTNKEENK